uniref:Putative nuclease HARBI1 n=1 Tax=Poecilia mexicana TaxID=48701 RepID=A0A3B3XW40_9TELE
LVISIRQTLSRRTLRSRAISPEVQVLAALGFYTSGSFQTSMGDIIGISQASMSRCVTNVTKALVEKAPQFITFNSRWKFVLTLPQQVAIKAPNSDASTYVNKKGFHSIACQLVCNARGLLLSAETWPGGLQDTKILQRSAIFKQGPTVMGVCSLKGDGRYPLKKWLMTPVESPGTAGEFQYNLAHTMTHEIVDRTFRAIQTRFRCLDGIKGNLQYSPERSSSILLACCVLHNASLHSGLDAWTLERTEPLEQPKGPEQTLEERDSEAEELRKRIILKHFS